MHYQKRDYDCGPAAVRNALEALHVRKGLSGLRVLCGTSECDGTQEDGIKRAFLAYGCDVDEWSSNQRSKSLEWLQVSISHGRPIVLCVDQWEHWITVIGALNQDFVIFDPANPFNGDPRQGGAAVVKAFRLMARWEASRRVRGNCGRFYGIAASLFR